LKFEGSKREKRGVLKKYMSYQHIGIANWGIIYLADLAETHDDIVASLAVPHAFHLPLADLKNPLMYCGFHVIVHSTIAQKSGGYNARRDSQPPQSGLLFSKATSQLFAPDDRCWKGNWKPRV
jgi:hypothetical protein